MVEFESANRQREYIYIWQINSLRILHFDTPPPSISYSIGLQFVNKKINKVFRKTSHFIFLAKNKNVNGMNSVGLKKYLIMLKYLVHQFNVEVCGISFQRLIYFILLNFYSLLIIVCQKILSQLDSDEFIREYRYLDISLYDNNCKVKILFR